MSRGDADVVITMLPNGAILRSVADQIIPAMKAGAVLLDCSTVDVESARAVAHNRVPSGRHGRGRPCVGRHWRGGRGHADIHVRRHA